MAAAWWRSSSRRNGGRTAQARVSPAKSTCPPKSSKTARMRPTPPPPAVPGPSREARTLASNGALRPASRLRLYSAATWQRSAVRSMRSARGASCSSRTR